MAQYLVSIQESLKRILETPKGSRVMLPDFGSDLYTLIDKRVDKKWFLLFMLYCFEAIGKYEPRIKLKRALPKVDGVSGEIKVTLEFEHIESKQNREVEISYGIA